MKNTFFLILLVATFGVMTQSCTNESCIDGIGPIVTETIDLADFNGIEITGAIDISITQGPEQSVIATGQQNIIDRLKRNVAGEVWDCSLTSGCYRQFDLNITITIPTLKDVQTTGSGNVALGTFDSLDNVRIVSSGSGNIGQNGDLYASEFVQVVTTGSGNITLGARSPLLTLNQTGSGNITMAGDVSRQNVKIDGSGNYSAFSMESDTCNITLTGSSNALVTVQDLLEGSITGSGNISYRGMPEINVNVTGSGQLVDAN